MRTGSAYMKHVGSCLPDLPIRWSIDDELMLGVLQGDRFDSSLLAAAVIGPLQDDFGVNAWYDDSRKTDLWMTRSPPYALQMDLAGVRYAVRVARLFDGRRFAVALNPVNP